MTGVNQAFVCALICVTIGSVQAITKDVLGHFLSPTDGCFCQLDGILDDCSCNADTIDFLNNNRVYPRVRSLLENNYFRYYKVNLHKACPFWTDDSRCAIRYCHVEPCQEDDIPSGLKRGYVPLHEDEKPHEKYIRPRDVNVDVDTSSDQSAVTLNCPDDDLNKELSYLNTTLTYKDLQMWNEYDDAQVNFCENNNEHDSSAQYVDLLLNPERYTGYRGPSAHRIWRSIYRENCFRPTKKGHDLWNISNISSMCLEKRAFYRIISGLHASINIHLSANYLLSDADMPFASKSAGVWGLNVHEFVRRFSPQATNGEGEQWLRNLYFLYLIELRALAKATPYLLNMNYFTGDENNDRDVRWAMENLLTQIKNFRYHFNESKMFSGSGQEVEKLKEEFRNHFRNISKIMDCVGCDKCKLWGKLQIQGLGTALKILFSDKFSSNTSAVDDERLPKKLLLNRSEVVSIINAFGRLSSSIKEIENFRKILHDRKT